MARESLSDSVEYEDESYGVTLFRDEFDEKIKLTNAEMRKLGELAE